MPSLAVRLLVVAAVVFNASASHDEHAGTLESEQNVARQTQEVTTDSITLSLPSEQVPRQADSCSDVLTTTFLDNNDEKRNCTWLADELSTDFNRANFLYCGKFGAFVLKDYRTPLAAVLCPATCNRPCTYASSNCKDSSALVGESALSKKKKKCNWIKKNAIRIARYCSAEEGIRSRGDAACPKTCGKCGQLSASAMTEAPSNAPSAVPTISPRPTSTPTAPPTVTSSANPSATASFSPSAPPTVTTSSTPSITASSSPSAAPSTSAPSDRPSMLPSITKSSEPTMTASSEPSVTASSEPSATASSEPSVTASFVPSSTPSVSPTSRPSLSPRPSPLPTEQPTRTPTSRPTYDLAQRAQDRKDNCGGATMINTYDFQKLPPIEAVCDVCVSTKECKDAGDGTIRCCKWPWAQVCMKVEGIWSEKQVENRCLL